MNAHVETGLHSTVIPAGRYHLIFSVEGTLVGTRSQLLSGLVPAGCDARDYSFASLPAFVRTLYTDIDSVLPKPVEGEIQRIDYAGHVLAFLPAANMGHNHAGWFDGLFLIPDALFDAIRTACAERDLNFDPERMTVDFDDEARVSLTLDPDIENENLVYPWVFFNDVSPTVTEAQFAGYFEMI